MEEAAPGERPKSGQDLEINPVWPPPPTNSPPAVQGTAMAAFVAYAPVGLLSWVVSALLAVFALISAAVLVAALLPPVLFHRAALGAAGLQALLLLATGVCFFVWTYRLNRNLRALGVTGLQFTPGWAVGYFFIPIMSLYRPYQIFREIWQGSDPGLAPRSGRAWQNIRPPALLGFWWVLWLISNLVDRLAAQTPNDTGAAVVGAAFSLISAVLALLVVRLWTTRQEKTARLLGLLA